MSIDTINGCIFLGTSIGNIFHLEYITYLTSIFCIISIYLLFKMQYKMIIYILYFDADLLYSITLYENIPLIF